MEKDKDIKIEKVVFNVEGEKISLNVAQAKKLKSLLDELFGKEIIKEVVEKHHYHNDWYYRPYIQLHGTPVIPSLNVPSYPIPQIYCSNNTLTVDVN